MPKQSKTSKEAARRGVYRTCLEIPLKTWEDLQRALQIRAQRAGQSTGAEVKTSFTAWVRAKAQETIEAYQ